MAPLNILVTGAGRGIGRGLTRLLLQKGHKVYMVDNNQSELEHATNHLRNIGAAPHQSVYGALCDVGRPEDVKKAVDQVAQDFNGRLDVLINNAAYTGAVGKSKFEELSYEEWQRSLQTNLTGPMLLSQACLPMLKKQAYGADAQHGGTIIMMSSTRAHQSEPHSEGYASTKAGLIGLTHSMATSLAESDMGISVNAILPGWINVAHECKEGDEKGARWEDGLSEEDHRWHLSGRVGRVEDILAAVMYLIENRFVNGTEMVVDGGVTRKMVYPE